MGLQYNSYSSWLHRASKKSILYSPTDAHSQFIKTIKIIEYYSNTFRFTQKPSSGSQSVLAKITYVVHWLHNWSCGCRQYMAA